MNTLPYIIFQNEQYKIELDKIKHMMSFKIIFKMYKKFDDTWKEIKLENCSVYDSQLIFGFLCRKILKLKNKEIFKNLNDKIERNIN